MNDKISLDLYLTTQIKRPIAKGSFTLNQLISNSQNNTTEIDIIRSYNNILTGKCLINHYYIKKISFAEKLAKKKNKKKFKKNGCLYYKILFYKSDLMTKFIFCNIKM